MDDDVVVVYMDDILVYTEDLEWHHEIVKEVLKRLQDNNFYLKPKKSLF
jgi:hypothetical protein